MVYRHLPCRFKRGFSVLGSLGIVALLGWMPGAWSYVRFMQVARSTSFGIPLNWMFPAYIVFVVAMVLRHGLIG